MKFFEILKINLRVGLCTLLLACFSFSLNAAEYTGRLSMHWNDKHHCTKHAQMFVDEVFKNSSVNMDKFSNNLSKIEKDPFIGYIGQDYFKSASKITKSCFASKFFKTVIE